MKRTKLIVVMAAVIFATGPSGYLLAQHMQGGPMMQSPPQQMRPTAESGQSSQQRESATGSEIVPPYGMGRGGGYGPGYGYGMGPGMMGPGMMGPGMGMAGGFGPGMGMMGPMMHSIMGSPQMMGFMMSMHGDMMAVMGRMIQRYGGDESPEVQQKMRTEMLQEMGDILVKHGNRLKESAKSSGR
jgi:hypothetical protein